MSARLPPKCAAIADQLASGRVDGPGRRGSHQKGSIADPTIARVVARAEITERGDDVLASIAEAVRHLRHAEQVMATTGRHHNADDLEQELRRARCTGGGGARGALEWGRPDCREFAIRAGLCSACYHCRRRWEAREAAHDATDAAHHARYG